MKPITNWDLSTCTSACSTKVAHHQLGFVYLHIGMLDKGQQEIEKALEINPGNTLARYRLGVIDMCQAKYAEAFQIFNSTPLEQNPELLAFRSEEHTSELQSLRHLVCR